LKNLQVVSQTQRPSLRKRLQSLVSNYDQTPDWDGRAIITGLMFPLIMMILNISMFGVALPTIRDTFNINANVTAWLITAFTLPYVIFMPLYGRLGDGLGKRRLLLIGIMIFGAGTIITILSIDLRTLILGRVVQGIGAASVDPLCLAIISSLFPANEWGSKISIWNSSAPLTTMVGFVASGFMVDYLGWRTIFGPVLLIGLVALVAVRRKVPIGEQKIQPNFLRSLDWGGIALLGAAITMMVFYVSSRPITGVAILKDWRLLITSLVLFGAFYLWEKRHITPFVSLEIFTYKNFSRASMVAATRMFILGGILFVAPLYLTDVRKLNATMIGIIIMFHAGALLLTVRTGGPLGDRWGDWRMVIIGPLIQISALSYLALVSETAPLILVVVAFAGNGLGGGLSLTAVTRFAMRHTPQEQSGMAAGLYSMGRFTGVIFGPVLAGVILQYGLDQSLSVIEAYHMVFWITMGVAILGIIIGWGLRD